MLKAKIITKKLSGIISVRKYFWFHAKFVDADMIHNLKFGSYDIAQINEQSY